MQDFEGRDRGTALAICGAVQSGYAGEINDLYLRDYGYCRINRLWSFQKRDRGHVRGGEGNVCRQTVTITQGVYERKLALLSVADYKHVLVPSREPSSPPADAISFVT